MKTCDLSFIKSHCANNPEFLNELIEVLLRETPVYLQAMSKCLEEKDWVGLHKNMHKMRPSIEFIGMKKEISEAAKQLEKNALNNENLESIPGLFKKIEQEFISAFEELKNELKKSN